MTVTAFTYDTFMSKALNKEIDWNSDTIKVALCDVGYVPDRAAHDYFSDVTDEIVGTGYTAGGVTLTGITITDTAHVWKLDADDALWSGSTITDARIAVIYDATPGSDATRPLIGYQDFGTDRSSSAGAFLVQWSASGLFTVTMG